MEATTKASLVHRGAEKIQSQLISFSFTVLCINVTNDKNELYTEKRIVLIWLLKTQIRMTLPFIIL